MPAITPLPAPPSRTDPSNFSARADAFLGALPALAAEINLLEAALLAAAGASMPVSRYVADTVNTGDVDPGNGKIRWNNTTPGSATQMFVDSLTSDGTSLATYFGTLGATGYVHVAADAGEWQIWRWTSPPVNAGGYWRFAVTLLAAAGTVDDVDTLKVRWDDLGSVAQTFYSVGGYYSGKPAGSSILLSHLVTEAATLPAGLTGSHFRARDAATGDAEATIRRTTSGGSASTLGTLTWAAAGTVPTVSFASDVSLSVGDWLEIVAPATADATLADIACSIRAIKG